MQKTLKDLGFKKIKHNKKNGKKVFLYDILSKFSRTGILKSKLKPELNKLYIGQRYKDKNKINGFITQNKLGSYTFMQ